MRRARQSAALAAVRGIRSSVPPRKVSFDENDRVFQSRSTISLLRGLLVLRICRIDFLARNSVPLMKRAESILGPFLTYQTVVKSTIYKHFCAGEDDRELKYTLKWLENQGVGSVLDYAAEADTEGFTPAPGMKEAPEYSMAALVNKTNVQYTMNNRGFDENMKLYMMCVMHAALNKPVNGFGLAAVKVSGMCDPQLLARMSAVLHSIHQSWAKNFMGEKVQPIEQCRIVQGTNKRHELFVSVGHLKKGLKSLCPSRPLTDEEVEIIVKALDTDCSGKINYFRYKQLVTEAIVALEPTPEQALMAKVLPTLTQEEKQLYKDVLHRLTCIVFTAANLDVRVLIDAEQTFYQTAIDSIVISLQQRFNKTAPIVYNTYQCYLTFMEDRIANDFLRAEQDGWMWGGKVVRGAYMIQERETACQYRYESPVWPTYEDTNACFNRSATMIFDEFTKVPSRKYEVLFGTHNKDSVQLISDMIVEMPRVESKAFFGQLFGMADNLTIPLVKAGFNVFKYVPYGPVKETIHYLGRRAVENSSILTGETAEVRMMKKELHHRWLWFLEKK